jgi:hypothetical protein
MLRLSKPQQQMRGCEAFFWKRKKKNFLNKIFLVILISQPPNKEHHRDQMSWGLSGLEISARFKRGFAQTKYHGLREVREKVKFKKN